MKTVLDTNVLVSGLLKPHSSCGKIFELLLSGVFDLCLDARILTEYRDVLHRPQFAFDPDQIEILLRALEDLSHWLPIRPLHLPMDDPDDLPFLEVALGARAHSLVTGHKRQFPESPFEGLKILEPGEFLERW